MTQQDNLRASTIFKYWLPLASSWMMMSFEGPYLSAIVARMDEPVLNLAAFGVTFAFGLLMEAPVIMLMAAATRLVKDTPSFKQLRNFSVLLSVLCTAVMLISLIPPVFDFWSQDLLGLEEGILQFVWLSVAFMLPWPGMIGIRRFHQGVLISQGHTKTVALGTVLRLVGMSVAAYLIYHFKLLHGAACASASLSVGVSLESIYIYLISKSSKRSLAPETNTPLSFSAIWSFYYPLALTALIGMSIQPLVTFGMNLGFKPLASLAVVPVVNGIVFFFRAIPLSFQEVIIALMGEKQENLRALKTFAIGLGIALTILLGLIALTPLSRLWFYHIAGLNAEMAMFAKWPLIICLAVPATSLWLCWLRSRLIFIKRTRPITYGSMMELTVVAALMFMGIASGVSIPAVSVAMISLAMARLVTITYLHIVLLRCA